MSTGVVVRTLANPEATIAKLRQRLERGSAPSVVDKSLLLDAIDLLQAAYPLPACNVVTNYSIQAEAAVQAQAKFLADNGMDGVNSFA
jgi:hypothetical protein